MVRFASLFDARERTVTFLSGKKYSVDDLHSMGAGELLSSMFEFSEKLSALQLSDEEMSLFTAVVLVSAGKPAGPKLCRSYNMATDWGEGGSEVGPRRLCGGKKAVRNMVNYVNQSFLHK